MKPASLLICLSLMPGLLMACTTSPPGHPRVGPKNQENDNATVEHVTHRRPLAERVVTVLLDPKRGEHFSMERYFGYFYANNRPEYIDYYIDFTKACYADGPVFIALSVLSDRGPESFDWRTKSDFLSLEDAGWLPTGVTVSGSQFSADLDNALEHYQPGDHIWTIEVEDGLVKVSRRTIMEKEGRRAFGDPLTYDFNYAESAKGRVVIEMYGTWTDWLD